jgi:hypothetical protein
VHDLEDLLSISSLAEDSALRLTQPAPDTATAVEVAARTAAEAVANQDSVADARQKGVEAAAATADPPSVQGAVLTQLVSFIPTETLLLYVAGETAFGDVVAPPGAEICTADFAGRWSWLAGIAVLTALLCAGLSYRKQKEINSAASVRMPGLEIGASTVAFVIWALSSASTPLRGVCGY